MDDTDHRPGQPLPSPGEIARDASDETPLERAERQIRELKSGGESPGGWAELTESGKLDWLDTLDWQGVSLYERLSVVEAEVDLNRVSPRTQRNYLGRIRDQVMETLSPSPAPPVEADKPAAVGQAEGIEAASTRYIIVPYGDDSRTDEPAPVGEGKYPYFFRVFVLTRQTMSGLGDFSEIAEAQEFVKLATGGKAEGQLFEAESYYDLPGFGRWPDVKSLQAAMPPAVRAAAAAVVPEAKPLPSPGDIADDHDGPELDNGKDMGRSL